MSETNGAVRARRPQLTDSIDKLDGMIDDLSVAIPSAVGESIREAMGPAFAAAVRSAVKQAVAEALKEVAAGAAAQPAAVPSAPASPTRPRRSVWTKARSVIGRVRRWVTRRVTPTCSQAAFGWTVVRLVSTAVVRSRVATFLTALSSAAAGLVGFTAGPIGASVLLSLTVGSVAAVAIWAAPTIRLFGAFRDDSNT